MLQQKPFLAVLVYFEAEAYREDIVQNSDCSMAGLLDGEASCGHQSLSLGPCCDLSLFTRR
jgi:hypothetical protein